ncbi:MAG: hypothetical protein JWL77_4889 [Chthonomonadaceae bacterium]|nr:hypothetical protein [Chthonomonadaceae bacterium]
MAPVKAQSLLRGSGNVTAQAEEIHPCKKKDVGMQIAYFIVALDPRTEMESS